MPANLPVSSTRVDLDDTRRRFCADDELLADLLTQDGRAAARARSRNAPATFRAHTVVTTAGALEAAAIRKDTDAFNSLFTNVARELGAAAVELTGTPAERL